MLQTPYGVKRLLTEKPVIIKLSELTTRKNISCAEAMKLAAQKAEKNKWHAVQFDHDHPPHFSGPGSTSKTVTLADSSQMIIPRSLTHVTKSDIGVNGFEKLVPNWKTVLQAV